MNNASQPEPGLKKFRQELNEIKDELQAVGKGWFALDTIKKIGREYRVWLNPKEQDIHNHGYFTLADLLAWKNDQGPIMMKRETS